MLEEKSKEDTRLNIWVVGRNYPTKQNRMCGTFELAQAKMLASRGHSVTYIALVFHPLYKAGNWGFWRSCEDGVRIITLSRFWAPQRLHIYFDAVKEKAWRKLFEVVEAETGIPDVIHMHFPSLLPAPQPLLEYVGSGTEVVATEHWTKVQRGKLDAHEKQQLAECVARSDAFLCVGSRLRDSVISSTGTDKEIYTVPNIASREFCPAAKTHDGFRFIAIGRLVKLKQFDKVIRIFSETFSADDDVTLEIVGDGPERPALAALIKRLEVSDRVKLAGELGKADTAERVRQSDCLVCYSSYETFGVPVIEAWASGIPAIASDAIGFKEYWKPELGAIVQKADERALSKAMVEVRDGIASYDSETIAEYANENFSEEAVYSSLIQIYKRCRRVRDDY